MILLFFAPFWIGQLLCWLLLMLLLPHGFGDGGRLVFVGVGVRNQLPQGEDVFEDGDDEL